MSSTKDKIEQYALELGFSVIGFTQVEPLDDESIRLKEWLSKNYHGDMKWMGKNSNRRTNPLLIYPDAKSVIVAAANYYSDVQRSDDIHSAKISRYAFGGDYHLVVKQKLNKLLKYIKSFSPEAEGKTFVDSGNMVEKDWARRAGIGWMGKHSIIISPQFGSWFFIGIILVNFDVESDTSLSEQCGDCNLCIEACPTQAIVEPYILDARKCISYQTIEKKGAIDPTLSDKFNGWIYGCDICQDVCPWNQKYATTTNISEFYPSEYNINPNLFELESISLEEFNEKFKNSPIIRIKHKKFIQNIRAVTEKYKGK